MTSNLVNTHNLQLWKNTVKFSVPTALLQGPEHILLYRSMRQALWEAV